MCPIYLLFNIKLHTANVRKKLVENLATWLFCGWAKLYLFICQTFSALDKNKTWWTVHKDSLKFPPKFVRLCIIKFFTSGYYWYKKVTELLYRPHSMYICKKKRILNKEIVRWHFLLHMQFYFLDMFFLGCYNSFPTRSHSGFLSLLYLFRNRFMRFVFIVFFFTKQQLLSFIQFSLHLD